MTDNIQVFKQDHVRMTAGEKVIHIDPFMTDSAPKDADYILITHDHYDHFSPKDIGRTAGRDCVLVVPETMKEKAKEAAPFVSGTVTVRPGESYDLGEIRFETVPAYNTAKPFHPKKAGWVGYIVHADGKRIYVAGDTDATDEAKAVKCDIALVPVGGTYTMNAKEAAALVGHIKPETAIPVHYGGVVGSKKDGRKFADAVSSDINVEIKISF